jgi:retron-type reverse transcriptase
MLREKVQDGRCITLMRELLKAGYMEDWRYHHTLSGTPQGGNVSPILSTSYLDKLDKFVETVLIPRYPKGNTRADKREYHNLMRAAQSQKKKGRKQEATRLRKQAQKLPTQVPNDPNYRRLNSVRYADDFLLGFVGPRSEAEEIKQQLAEFLQNELELELSKTKTLMGIVNLIQ